MKRMIERLEKCFINCPGCGSSNVTGEDGGPYVCHSCGSIWQ